MTANDQILLWIIKKIKGLSHLHQHGTKTHSDIWLICGGRTENSVGMSFLTKKINLYFRTFWSSLLIKENVGWVCIPAKLKTLRNQYGSLFKKRALIVLYMGEGNSLWVIVFWVHTKLIVLLYNGTYMVVVRQLEQYKEMWCSVL